MKPKRFLATALIAELTSTGAIADIPTQSGFSMYINRMVATALPYREDSRWQSYLTISRIAEILFHDDQFGADIATLPTDTFDGYPLLFLTDETGDHRADFYAYHQTEAREFTKEFGTFFSAGESPSPAWIVFNNGTIPDNMSADASDWSFYWATHQFVDRNGDGRFDLYISNGADVDDDGKFGIHETEWAFDDDFDGRLDRAEINISGEARELDLTDGVFAFAGMGDVAFNAAIYGLGDAIAADIRNALKGVPR